MGIISTVKQTFDKVVNRSVRPNLAASCHLLPGSRLLGREASPKAEQQLARNQSYVFACQDRIGNSMADAVLRVFAQTGENQKRPDRAYSPVKVEPEIKRHLNKQSLIRPCYDVQELKSHGLIDLWRNVNPWMNSFELIYLTNTFMALTGSAYWYILKDDLGTPIEIWPLKTQWVRVIPSCEDFIEGYWYGPSSANRVYMGADEVIWFPNQISTFDFRKGKSTLSAAIEASDLYQKMNNYETSVLDNMGVPESVLLSEQPIPNKEERSRILGEWRRAYGGVKNARKTALLEGGLDFKTIGLSPREMEFLKGRDVTREEIAGVFGVPLSLLTIEGVNRATADTNFYIFQEVTVKPRLMRIQQTLNQTLVPMFDDSGRLFISFDDPVPQDKEFELRRMQTSLQVGLSTRNEERRLRSLDCVEDGDVLLVPTNVNSIENILEGNSKQSTTGADTDPDDGASRDGSGRVPDE